MLVAEVIRKKRDGEELTPEEIQFVVRAYTDGRMADYQMSALAMAICIRGMTVEETVALTEQMLNSGARLSWTEGTVNPKVDKHSTGGLGDKVSIVLAPLLAAVGLHVPMISGRGLGLTGGTLDKLESIPGFRTELSIEEIQRQTEEIGCVICGASSQLAPADRRLYALRDVTATVESIPLITASILSKKLAESISSLVLDVKFGSGAFMTSIDDATRLAESLVSVGNRLGVRTRALITDMNQPLGRAVGNTVEILESMEVLRGEGPSAVRELTLALAAELLVSEARVASRTEALMQLEKAIDSGYAYERFEAFVAAQGGRLPAVEPDPVTTLQASRSGWLTSIDGRQLGQVLIALGGGRRLADDQVDHRVGLDICVKLGDEIQQGQPLCQLFADPVKHDTDVDAPLVTKLNNAFAIGDEAVSPSRLIVREVS